MKLPVIQRILSSLLGLAVVFSLAACAGKKKKGANPDAPPEEEGGGVVFSGEQPQVTSGSSVLAPTELVPVPADNEPESEAILTSTQTVTSTTTSTALTTPPSPTITVPATTVLKTNASTLVVQGSCITGNTIELSGDVIATDIQSPAAKLSQSCTNNAFAFTIQKAMDGVFQLSLLQRIKGGTLASKAVKLTWTRDTSAPSALTITQPVSLHVTDHASSLAIAGSCEKGGTVYLGGDVATQSAACANGTFSFSANQLTDGTLSLSLSQTDAVGNSSSPQMLTWTRDTLAPAPPSITTPATAVVANGDNTLTISGGCDSGNSVLLTGDTTSNVSCSGGAYSFTVSKLSDGTYNLSVSQRDLAGNTSAAATLSWTRDTSVPEPPTVTTPGTNSAINSASILTISGSCSNDMDVEISGDLTAADVSIPSMALVTGCAGGAYTFELNKMTDGTYGFSLRQINPVNGNASTSTAISWIRDTLAPPPPTVTSPAISPFTSSLTSLTISGGCQSGNTVTLSGDSDQSLTCTASAYSFTFNASQDGTYVFNLTQTDAAGNVSSGRALEWHRNSSMPNPPTITVPAASPFASKLSSITISGACTDGYEVKLSGDVVANEVSNPSVVLSQTCNSASYAFTINKSVDNTYTFNLKQINPLNHMMSSDSQMTWIRDTMPPSAPTIVAPAANPFVSGDTSITIQGGCLAGLTVSLQGNASSTQVCSNLNAYTFTVSNATDGTYNYTLVQSDAAGNSSSPVAVQWIRDTSIPPTPTITVPGQATVYNSASSLQLSGSCVTNNTIDLSGAVQASDITSPLGSLSQTCLNSTYSFTIGKSVDGSYALSVDQTDSNTGLTSGSATLTWVRDTTTPAALVILEPNANPVVSAAPLIVSGTCETGAKVDVTGDGVDATTCSNGSFSFSLSQASDGTYYYTLRQTDLAGNASTASSLQWQMDSSVPATPTISSPASATYQSSASALTLSGGCTPSLLVTLGGNISSSEVTSPAGALTQICSPVGTFTYTVAKTVDGTYDLTVMQSNAGTNSAAAVRRWVRDATPPALTITSGPTTNYALKATFVFSSNDPNASLQCQIGAASYASCQSPYTVTLTPASNGTQTFSVRGIDTAGNVGTPATHSWTQTAFNTVALYHFETPTTDSSLYTSPVNNGLTDSQTQLWTGIFGQARFFGTNGFMTSANTASQQTLTSTMTVEAYVNFSSLSLANNTYYSLVSKDGATTGNNGWRFRIKKTSKGLRLAFMASTTGSGYLTERTSSPCTLSTGTWYHLAVTWNLGTVTFYCNGASVGTGTVGTAGTTKLFATTAPIYLGREVSGASKLIGSMDEVRISQILRWSTSITKPTSAYSAD